MGSVNQEPQTNKKLCEHICKVLSERFDHFDLTPEELWHASSTGELYHVFSLEELVKILADTPIHTLSWGVDKILDSTVQRAHAKRRKNHD